MGSSGEKPVGRGRGLRLRAPSALAGLDARLATPLPATPVGGPSPARERSQRSTKVLGLGGLLPGRVDLSLPALPAALRRVAPHSAVLRVPSFLPRGARCAGLPRALSAAVARSWVLGSTGRGRVVFLFRARLVTPRSAVFPVVSAGARAGLGVPARRAAFPVLRRFLGEASTVSLRTWSPSSVNGAPAPARRMVRSMAGVRL